ncbi:MAG: hypothetical protein LUD81_04845 [Clostridiales bacterium]|nr:hypothetical protein [Clostridiales bacterium]
MDGFFPCSQERFKKLLKVIDLDYDHREEHKEKIRVYLDNKIPKLKNLYEEKLKRIEFYTNNPKQKEYDVKEAEDILKWKDRIEKNKAFFEKAVNI